MFDAVFHKCHSGCAVLQENLSPSVDIVGACLTWGVGNIVSYGKDQVTPRLNLTTAAKRLEKATHTPLPIARCQHLVRFSSDFSCRLLLRTWLLDLMIGAHGAKAGP